MRNFRLLFIYFVVVHLISLAGPATATELRIGDKPILPILQRLDGKVIDPAIFHNKVLVISYFASTCPFCMNEAPKLQKLYHDNKDKLIVIGVNVERNDPQQLAKTKQWVQKYKLTYPVTTEFTAVEKIMGKIKGLPVNHILDRQGKVVRIDVGEIFDEDFNEILRLAK